MNRHTIPGSVLLGWMLLSAARDGWEPIGEFPGSFTCERVRAARIDDDVRRDIGSVLADQPADNPMRAQAYARAERRARERYRCEWRS